MFQVQFELSLAQLNPSLLHSLNKIDTNKSIYFLLSSLFWLHATHFFFKPWMWVTSKVLGGSKSFSKFEKMIVQNRTEYMAWGNSFMIFLWRKIVTSPTPLNLMLGLTRKWHNTNTNPLHYKLNVSNILAFKVQFCPYGLSEVLI